MNKPNEELLSKWLEGELEGDELKKMEAWATEHAGDLDSEFKCEIGWDALSDDLLKCVPKEEEPPYPEFFNSKLEQAILADISDGDAKAFQSSTDVSSGLSVVPRSMWQKLRSMLVPTAVAGAIAFYAGMQIKGDNKGAKEMVVEVIYVPDENVEAIVSDTGLSTEIVLDGLSPISDDFDMNISSKSSEKKSMTAAYQENEEKIFY